VQTGSWGRVTDALKIGGGRAVTKHTRTWRGLGVQAMESIQTSKMNNGGAKRVAGSEKGPQLGDRRPAQRPLHRDSLEVDDHLYM
jgi:hypothetical protein